MYCWYKIKFYTNFNHYIFNILLISFTVSIAPVSISKASSASIIFIIDLSSDCTIFNSLKDPPILSAVSTILGTLLFNGIASNNVTSSFTFEITIS